MNPTLIFWWNIIRSGEILLKEIRFHTAKQIIEFCSCAKFATSRDISSWIVFMKRGSDGKSSVRRSAILQISNRYVPYMRIREFTSRCLHLSSTCRVSNYPARHECRSPDRPHNAGVCGPCAYVNDGTWTVEGDHAARQMLYTRSPCEIVRELSYIGKNEKRVKPREGGNWSASYLCRPSRKRPGKQEKNYGLF